MTRADHQLARLRPTVPGWTGDTALGWEATCSCGWQNGPTLPTKNRARREWRAHQAEALLTETEADVLPVAA